MSILRNFTPLGRRIFLPLSADSWIGWVLESKRQERSRYSGRRQGAAILEYKVVKHVIYSQAQKMSAQRNTTTWEVRRIFHSLAGH